MYIYINTVYYIIYKGSWASYMIHGELNIPVRVYVKTEFFLLDKLTEMNAATLYTVTRNLLNQRLLVHLYQNGSVT